MNEKQNLGRFIEVGGIRTHYHDAGTGDPLILLHGSAPGVSAWSNWQKTIETFSKSYRVIAPDIPGFGHTERSEETDYGMKFWIDHLAAFMDKLDIESANFVGNSFGGALTLSMACLKPERVKKIVLMGTGGLGFNMTDGLRQVLNYKPSEENMRQLLLKFVYDSTLITEDLVNSRYNTSMLPLSKLPYKVMSENATEVNGKTFLPGIPEEVISEIKNDALILHGKEDLIIPVEVSYQLHKLLSNSQVHSFSRCGHWVQIEQQSLFNNLVSEFLKRE